tara:strand:+ start:378 stop:872 length:495 start_codon:yes stop_codon:yes gene_type:complete
MKLGNINFFSILFLFLLIAYANSQEKLILENLQPTFEEEEDTAEKGKEEVLSLIKSKKQKKILTNQTVVKIRALDKITAKTSDIDIVLGEKKKFGYLEILPKNCKKADDESGTEVLAYLQVKDLSDKKDKQVFVFNGWTFSESPTLKPFDHPVYDLWLTGCENI